MDRREFYGPTLDTTLDSRAEEEAEFSKLLRQILLVRRATKYSVEDARDANRNATKAG